MRKIDFAVRIILGMGLVFFGLNGFFQWIAPPQGSETEMIFMMALASAGYIFPITYAVQIISGLTFLTNRFVPVGLLILTPILINIVLVHLRFSPEAILFGGIFFILMLLLYYTRRDKFLPLFQ